MENKSFFGRGKNTGSHSQPSKNTGTSIYISSTRRVKIRKHVADVRIQVASISILKTRKKLGIKHSSVREK